MDLSSVGGKGTTIRLKIPLTLAIIPALVITGGGVTFAIPQIKLVELVRVDQGAGNSRIEYLQGTPVYRLRDHLLPLVDLCGVLGLESRGNSDNHINIAVLNADNTLFGLIVEEVQDTADIVVKPLNPLLKPLQVYSGATILGDGSVALILDALGLAKHARIGNEARSGTEASAGLDAARSQSTGHQDYILVRVNSPTKHAMVLNYVHRLEEFDRSAVEFSGNRKVIRYRDSVLHIVSAAQYLGYGERDGDPASEKLPIVVVEKAGVLFGIEVDEILDTLSSEIDPEHAMQRQLGIFGHLNTPSELIVVIDPLELIIAAYPETELRPAVSARGKRVRPKRILLAEDTVFFKKTIGSLLAKAGCEVFHASDGQEAIDAFNRSGGSFDLIVSDIEMPHMNGFELAKAVRSSKVNPDVPMLAVSSKANESYRSKGIDSGFNVYLEKLKPEALLQAVRDLTAEEDKAS